MIRTNIKFAWRRLIQEKRNTWINLIGLSSGLIGFLLILQYISYEKSYDQFHAKKNSLYRIGLEIYRQNRLSIRSAINYPGVGPALKTDFPEVDRFLRLGREQSSISIGNNHFREENLFFADSSFFEMFSFPLVEGDNKKILSEPNSIAVSASVANKYFGTTDCLGKMIHCENHFLRGEFKITGVFKDLPANTHLLADVLISWSTYNKLPGYIQPWQYRDFHTYVLLKENADANAFFKKITAGDYIDTHAKRFASLQIRNVLVPQPVTDIYLYSTFSHEMSVTGNGNRLNYLFLIALFVLIMAWANGINLSTAMANNRRKEIGVRKTIGAGKRKLISQFFMEAMVLNGAALVISVLFLIVCKPYFNAFVGKSISMPFTQWILLFIFLGLSVLISNWYPAMILANFNPLQAIKGGQVPASKYTWLRKGLTIFQFFLSTTLVVCTFIFLTQLNHLEHIPMGMQIDQTVVVRAPLPNDSIAFAGFKVFKEKLNRYPFIQGVVASHIVPGDEEEWTTGMRRYTENTNSNSSITCSANAVDIGFLKQYRIPVKWGRDFSLDYGTDRHAILLTETACKKLNFTDFKEALNERYLIHNDTFTVIGITGDFHHYGMQYAAEPYVFFQKADEYRKYSVKISGDDITNALRTIKDAYEDVFPKSNFEFVFADELFAKQYDGDRKTGILVTAFTILAIIIACLGLYGLLRFITSQRTKEIAIRKVLGAGIKQVVFLLSIDSIKLIGISIALATPVSWWIMNSWLQSFANRITLSWVIFLPGILITTGIALATVGLQVIKTGRVNPVKSLKQE